LSTAQYKYKYEYNSPVHPKKFAMWIAIGSIVMAFAGLTSAYIVKKGAGYWVEFNLPQMFLISTIVIAVSSISMQMAYYYYKRLQSKLAIGATIITFILGCVFLYTQYEGWIDLNNSGIQLNGNPSGSFVYVISGLHFAHIVGGLIALFATSIGMYFRNRNTVKQLMEEVNPERMTGLNLLATYWHFVGILWLYLYIFFQTF